MTVVLNKALRSSYAFFWLFVVIAIAPLNSAHAIGLNFAQTVLSAQLTLDQDSKVLKISTDDHLWTIQLEQTSVLGANEVLQAAILDLPFFYRGSILNNARTWVRINSELNLFRKPASLDEASLSGYIFVNETLYNLRHEPLTGYTLVPLQNNHPKGIDFTARNSNRQTTISTNSQTLNAPALHKAIKIGIVIDSKFDEYYNGRGLAVALGIINGVDGLFQDQLGLAVTIESHHYFNDADTDPLRHFSNNMEERLNQFRLNRISDNELDPDLALVHLFSGNSDPTQPIGLSWIGTLCQSDGYDVSISTPFPYNMLLSAHEIAHNLGAIHDDEQRCLNDPTITSNEVMWSELSHNTTATFSNCSIDSMRTALSSSCVANNIELSMNIMSTPTKQLFEQEVIISARNWDASRVARQITSVTEFPNSLRLSSLSAGCSATSTTLTCAHGNVNANSTSSATATVLYANSDPATITGELLFSDFMDTNSSNNNAGVQVDFNAQTSSANTLAANDDEKNRIDSTGRNSGLGGLGSFSLLCLILLLPKAAIRTKAAQNIRSTE